MESWQPSPALLELGRCGWADWLSQLWAGLSAGFSKVAGVVAPLNTRCPALWALAEAGSVCPIVIDLTGKTL